MNTLYPLKFKPIVKKKIWGSETWVLSGVSGSQTQVSNGFLAGNDLNDLVEIYMDDLVGEAVFEKFGTTFPLLLKFIEAHDYLSIQVHPDDALAAKRKIGSGKSEMWYIMNAEPGAELIAGFSKPTDPKTYLDHLAKKNLKELLNFEKVQRGDVFYIPAGRIHALGPGIKLAEIQQTSDTTYRIYDWDRVDEKGNPRELHTELALEAIDFEAYPSYKTSYPKVENKTVTLVENNHFTTNLIALDKPLEKDYTHFDCFVIYLCVEGAFKLVHDGGTEDVGTGESILLPGILDKTGIVPIGKCKILEIYI
jgi:mannose-6-phosphate isomerase